MLGHEVALPTPEEKVAENLERLRTEAGLTYDGLAQKLMSMGIRIHPSAIQKTEKSGRKATIKEMLAYSRLFNIPVQQLWGEYAPTDEVVAVQRDLAAAEKILKIQKHVHDEYERTIRGIAELAAKDANVRADLTSRVVQQTGHILFLANENEILAKEKEGEGFGLSIYGWEHAASLLGDVAEVPIELETAIDCLRMLREMEGEPAESWESLAAREADSIEQARDASRRKGEPKHGE